jgi:hypothetical protein
MVALPGFGATAAIGRARQHYVIIGNRVRVPSGTASEMQAAALLLVDGEPIGQIIGIGDQGQIYYDPMPDLPMPGLSEPRPIPTDCEHWECPNWCSRNTMWGICVFCCQQYECVRPRYGANAPRPPRVPQYQCARGGTCWSERDLCPRP